MKISNTKLRFALTVALILGLGIGTNVATLGLLYRYYVSPHDPLTLGITVAVLAITTLLACYLPARRATKLNPAEVIYDQ